MLFVSNLNWFRKTDVNNSISTDENRILTVLDVTEYKFTIRLERKDLIGVELTLNTVKYIVTQSIRL